ncbi:MAG: hypothetical protein GX122_07715 [Candidatus Cloacimonetes bacterium]|nr:hypothetical protein [Candidatus Cloacimonadota bacterium]NLO12288.1 hypothetical protein [Candidatus Cloacimonadota bacterium]
MTTDKSYTQLHIQGERIEIEVEGVPVHGRITLRDRSSIGVKIISPYTGISELSGSIPVILGQFKNFLGSRGDEKAASLLSQLYRFCLYAQEHKDRLLTALQDFKSKLDYAQHLAPKVKDLAQRKTAMQEDLRAIRKELKAGKMDNIEYQRRIGPLKKSLELLSEEMRVDSHAIFKASFTSFKDTPVWELRHDTVLKYLEGLAESERP